MKFYTPRKSKNWHLAEQLYKVSLKDKSYYHKFCSFETLGDGTQQMWSRVAKYVRKLL